MRAIVTTIGCCGTAGFVSMTSYDSGLSKRSCLLDITISAVVKNLQQRRVQRSQWIWILSNRACDAAIKLIPWKKKDIYIQP